LARELAGERAAGIAVLLAAGAPFVLHEIYFTWPKLLASAFVLLGLQLIWTRRPFAAGLILGIGYWCHPGALLSLPVAGLLWLLRHRSAEPGGNERLTWLRVFRSKSVYLGGLSILAGIGALVALWG